MAHFYFFFFWDLVPLASPGNMIFKLIFMQFVRSVCESSGAHLGMFLLLYQMVFASVAVCCSFKVTPRTSQGLKDNDSPKQIAQLVEVCNPLDSNQSNLF